MTQQTFKTNLYFVKYDFQEEGRFHCHESAGMGDASTDWMHIREVEFTAEVPDNFDPRPQQVAALEAEKQKVRAEFAARITELDSRISKLLAIENTVEA